MIKYIYLAFKQLQEKKLVNIIMMIQVLLTLIVINITVGTIQQMIYITKLTNNTELKNAVYFSALPRVIAENFNDLEFIDNEVSSNKGVFKICKSNYFKVMFSSLSHPVEINVYNNMMKAFKLPLSSGSWFSDANNVDFEQIIISKELSKLYKIGSIIDVYDINTKLKSSKPVKVIGILDNSKYTLKLGAGGDLLALNNIFIKNEYYGILLDNNIKRDANVFDEYGRLLFLDDNQIYEDLKLKLKDIGFVHKISEMEDRYQANIQKKLTVQLTLFFIIFILSCTGIGGNNALMQINKEKEYAIYFTCGMEWNYCLFITIFRNVFILIIPSIAAFFWLTYSLELPLFQQLIINSYNFIFSILLIIIIFIITSLEPLYVLYKTNPIRIIRRNY